MKGTRRRSRLRFVCGTKTKPELMLDAILIGETDLAILFSYTRAYFRVERDVSIRIGALACANSCRGNA